MAAVRPKRQRQPARGPVQVPTVIALGVLVDLWSDTGDVAEASRRYGEARRQWERAEGLDGPRSYALLSARRPWSLSDHDALHRWALAGAHPADDLDALRRAARQYDTDTRRTP